MRYIHEDGETIKLRLWTLLHFSRKFYFKNEFYKPKRFSIVQTKFEAYDWLKKKKQTIVDSYPRESPCLKEVNA